MDAILFLKREKTRFNVFFKKKPQCLVLVSGNGLSSLQQKPYL